MQPTITFEIMEEFLRKYTEEEFNQLFKEAGYPEIAREFLFEECNKCVEDLIKDEIGDEPQPIDALIQDLKDYDSWTCDTVRDEAWKRTIEENTIATYCDQRAKGHSHDWAAKYVNSLADGLTGNIYKKTYDSIVTCPDADADSEIEIVAKRLAGDRSGFFVKFLVDILKERDKLNIEELILSFDIYDKLLGNKHSEAYSAAHFYFSSEYDAPDDDCIIYAESFEAAIGFGKPFYYATDFADEFAGYWANEYFLHVETEFLERNPEIWERELYYKFLVRQYEKVNDGELNALIENMYLKELGLPVKDTEWMYNDKLFVSAKALLAKSGLPEEDSVFCAYQIAFEGEYKLPPLYLHDKSLIQQIENLICKYI